ncbi:DJ-1 domain InhA-type [Penicillium canescens]|uniref:DJ-1 domain InhA-type n=1 Tax=Penicillium canescens TaxID=5083 RepID=A0AAD6I2U2_PENCN|nr:DJ-1 domain InhA-type [Penicillium canescens]KAJ6027150.1 DJ-1 domain InhA-type [Penicillium canescens]KAJ6040433.1 DJ-1 domain InhA-type [Penicillium canescens]KAJ6067212.1 DJ-1 domain InhA-type [Penicillium canescens]
MSQILRIGVILVGSVQLLDLAAVDLLYMATPEYLNSSSLTQALIDMGRPCQIHYIGQGGASNMTPATAQMSIQLTDAPTDEAVSPGKLDVVIVPGPSLKAMPPAEEYLDFVRGHYATGASILGICTGTFIIGYSGITKGRYVTAPRLLVPEMRKLFPEASLWDDGVRLARDGNLWTSGGITNGHDLVVEYLRENYPAPLVNAIIVQADITPRLVHYSSPATINTAVVTPNYDRRHPEVSDPQVNRSSSFPNSTPNLQFFKQCPKTKNRKPNSMITLSIIIYVASPLDYARYRHAALYLEYGEPAENGDTNANTEANANAETHDTETPSQLTSSVVEIVGSTGFFTLVERLNWQPPLSSTDIARVIRVDTLNESGACTTPSASPNRDLDHNPDLDLTRLDPISRIRDLISKTPIRSNGDAGADGEEDWNSQNWVGDALGRLVLAGYLSGHARDLGIERMIEVIMEAGDEEVLV